MKALNRPEWDAGEDFDAILAVKRKPDAIAALTEVQPAVHAAGSRYRDCAPHLEAFEAERVSSAQKSALLNCFAADRRTAPCKAMLARINRLNPGKCPLCGVDNASTFDHYLPESLFSELVVCAYNLVPACFRCNNFRGNRWLGEFGRTTLHLYYDQIPANAEPVLEAEVIIGTDGPAAQYRVEAGLDSLGFPGRFARHCHGLGLLEVFNETGTEKLIDILDDLRGRDFNAVSAMNNLRHIAQSRARYHGANHWEAALHRGAARSEEFIRYALAGEKP